MPIERQAMIDIHSHILFGLDDGARSFEESVAMVKAAGAAGTTDIVASPHANEDYRFEPETVEAKIAELQAAAGASPVIHYGCDFHLTPENIADALRAPGRYSIDHHSYLLVEFSDLAIPRMTGEIFAALAASGTRPVITHPERNTLLRRRMDHLEEWVRNGCLIQVTAQSLLGAFGKPARKSALALLERGLVHVLASDGHDLRYRPPVLDGAWRYVSERYGEAIALRLLAANPQAILAGAPVETVAPVKTRSWFSWRW